MLKANNRLVGTVSDLQVLDKCYSRVRQLDSLCLQYITNTCIQPFIWKKKLLSWHLTNYILYKEELNVVK